MLALPRGPVELPPQDLRKVDLDDDVPVEVVARIHVEVLVSGAGEAVVADDTVGDEVAGARSDVVHGHLDAERLNRFDSQPRRTLERLTLDRSLARDRRIDREEEAEM